MAGVAPGIAAWGLMTGVAMVKSGMSTVEALFMALTVFAGSSQLAAIPLLLAGAPMWVILATGFCVNLRFVVFSAHLRPYVMHLPRWQRMVMGYFTADLTYVLFVKRFTKPAQYRQRTIGVQAGQSQQAGFPAVVGLPRKVALGKNFCEYRPGCRRVGLAVSRFAPKQFGNQQGQAHGRGEYGA